MALRVLAARTPLFPLLRPNPVCHSAKRSISILPNGPVSKTTFFLLGGTVLGAAYFGRAYYQKQQEMKVRRAQIISQLHFDEDKRELVPSAGVNDNFDLEKVKSLPVSRRIPGVVKFPAKLTLFQYATCPFCCKVRAFLDFYGLPYQIIEVNPVLRRELKFSSYRKVPILIVSQEDTKDTRVVDSALQLNDSTLIISLLASFLTANTTKDNLNQLATLYPRISMDGSSEVVNKYFVMQGDMHNNGTQQTNNTKAVINRLSEERKWREWADRVLVHTLSPNVYRTLDESIHTFKSFSISGEWERLFPTWERLLVIYLGSFAMWMIGKRLAKRYNLKEDVRLSLYDSVNYWLKNGVGPNGRFMGGQQPNLADLAVYGVLNSIEGTWAFSDLLSQTNVLNWYMGVKEMVVNRKGRLPLPS